ncbi:hypothetical protein [Actinomyces sp.]
MVDEARQTDLVLAWSGFVDPADEFGSELLTQVIAHEFEGTDIVQNHPL